jgi:hypothetical protein
VLALFLAGRWPVFSQVLAENGDLANAVVGRLLASFWPVFGQFLAESGDMANAGVTGS